MIVLALDHILEHEEVLDGWSLNEGLEFRRAAVD